MKFIKLIMLFCIGAFFVASNAVGQANPTISVLPGNSGIVAVGATLDLQIDIGNTGLSTIAVAKLRPNIAVPASVTFLPDADQTGLPAGWTILSNSGSQLRICNTSFVVPAQSTTTIILKVRGVTVTPPQTFSGQINFGNGTTCAAGTAVAGNNTADDNATSTIEVIAAPACALTVSAAAGTIACNGGTTTLTATPGSANGAVEYSITGGAPFQASNVFTVAAGTYTVSAREVSNTTCTATATPVTITEPTAVVASAVITTPIASIGGTGTITVSAAGGTAGTTTYDITSGTSSSNTSGDATGVYTGLLAGTYTFTVTKAGCPAVTAPLTLSDPAPCIITGVTVVPGTIACNGGTTTLTATAAPVGPTYEFSLNGGAFQASNVFTAIAAGPYSIVAREVSNPVCTQSAGGTLTQPATVSASAAVSTPIAVPGGTGTITVSATGGTGAFTYVITAGSTINTTGSSSGVFTGLSAGSYSFTATDANSCVGTATVVLSNPGVATADPAVGQMYFTTTSGAVQNANTLLLAPNADLYDINIPFYNLNQLNSVPAGTIRFTVNLGSKLVLAPGFDLATAPLSTYFTWTQANVNGNIILTGTQSLSTPIPADFDGIATFRVKGDSACRSNVVSNIIITNQLQTLADDDLQNNTATLQYTLPITLTKTQVNVTCNAAGNGVINITATSGVSVLTTGPSGYTNTTSLASGVNGFTLSGLAPGTYSITASAAGDPTLGSCSIGTTVIITEPTVLAIPAANVSSTSNNCFNANAGTITVVATGGTQPYTYTLVRTAPSALAPANTTGAITGIFTGLPAGTYQVTVTDNNGCAVSTPGAGIVITQPVGGIPDITLGSDISGSLFATPGVTQTIVYNVAEINGTSAVGDTIRITKVAGFTINFDPTIFSTTATGAPLALDNPRWKIDNSNPAFVSIILTDPSNTSNPGTLLCNQLVRVAITITRNTPNISTFTLSARLRQANGETNLSNNFNSIVFAAD